MKIPPEYLKKMNLAGHDQQKNFIWNVKGIEGKNHLNNLSNKYIFSEKIGKFIAIDLLLDTVQGGK